MQVEAAKLFDGHEIGNQTPINWQTLSSGQVQYLTFMSTTVAFLVIIVKVFCRCSSKRDQKACADEEGTILDSRTYKQVHIVEGAVKVSTSADCQLGVSTDHHHGEQYTLRDKTQRARCRLYRKQIERIFVR